jgi:aspartyl-tRNA synthetase
VEGKVIERASKNPKMDTGEIEIVVSKLVILNESEIPPFNIANESDGGDELRMKYRYLDLRRKPLQDALILRHNMAIEARKYLNDQQFP